jgi:phage-related protein
LLFAFNEKTDSYIILHSFRGGPEGATRSDLRNARRRLKTN